MDDLTQTNDSLQSDGLTQSIPLEIWYEIALDCDPDTVINLSYVCRFLSPLLRDYINENFVTLLPRRVLLPADLMSPVVNVGPDLARVLAQRRLPVSTRKELLDNSATYGVYHGLILPVRQDAPFIAYTRFGVRKECIARIFGGPEDINYIIYRDDKIYILTYIGGWTNTIICSVGHTIDGDFTRCCVMSHRPDSITVSNERRPEETGFIKSVLERPRKLIQYEQAGGRWRVAEFIRDLIA